MCKFCEFAGKKRFEVITYSRTRRFQVVLVDKFESAIEYLMWKTENSRAQITWRPRDGYCSLWKLAIVSPRRHLEWEKSSTWS